MKGLKKVRVICVPWDDTSAVKRDTIIIYAKEGPKSKIHFLFLKT